MSNMMSFDEFHRAAPSLATPILDRITSTGFALFGTVRRDGSPG